MSDSSPRRLPRVDVHSHTFNASDLSVHGFLKSVVLNADEMKLRRLANPLVKLLDRLASEAPSFEEEEREIRNLLRADGEIGFERLVAKASRASGDAPMPERLDSEMDEFGDGEIDDATFFEMLDDEIERLRSSTDPDDLRLFKELSREASLRQTVLRGSALDADTLRTEEAFPFQSTLDASIPTTKAAAARFGGGTIMRYIRWLRLLLRYRYKITRKLLHQYGRPQNGAPAMDVFVTALVDFQRWLQDAPATPIPEQIDLMELNVLLHEGRLLPFVPFDPWREAARSNSPQGSFYWVKEAIETRGFVGVKLYPPMGFAPIGNEGLDFTALGYSDEESQRNFGRLLDEALRSLYAWCEEHEVPILAHCSDSQESKENYGLRASPEGWASVLEEFPKLRVNLGHFGGHRGLDGSPDNPDVENGKGWAWVIGTLMSTYDHVYADTGHFYEVRSASFRENLVENLTSFFDRHPVGRERLMYGSDWLLLAKEKNADGYLQRFDRLYREAFGDTATEKFLGTNALQYLGLDHPDRKAFTRLSRFYQDRHGIDLPDWMNQLVDPPLADAGPDEGGS